MNASPSAKRYRKPFVPNIRARQLLDENQVDEFKEAFRVFDADGGGTIDAHEYSNLMAMLGMTNDEEVLAEMFTVMDSDSDGELQFEEFLILMATLMHTEDNTDDVLDAFDLIDKEGKGWIPIETCRYLMEGLAENLTDEEVESCLRALDPRRDGKVSLENIKVFLQMTKIESENIEIEDVDEVQLTSAAPVNVPESSTVEI